MTSAVTQTLSTRRIDPRLSSALDTLRAAAAVYVVAHHVISGSSSTGAWTMVFRFGQEAVIVFFLLSGFLIFASERNRVLPDLRGYYLRRARRIYPLLLVAFGVSALVALSDRVLAVEFSWRELIFNLLAWQDVSALKPGVVADPFLGNSPLWSLSYEVFFYLVFPVVMVAHRVSRRVALNLVGGLGVVGYATYLAAPNHISLVIAYLLVWWAGAVLADLYLAGNMNLKASAPVAIWLLALCSVAMVGVLLHGYEGVGVFPALPLRHFAFVLLCVVFCVSPLAKWGIATFSGGGKASAYLASISYGLYVLHWPLLVQWDVAQTTLGLFVAVLVLAVMATLGDRTLDRVLPRPRKLRP